MVFFVYLVECSDGSYYCGYTKDLDTRLNAHNTGKASKYTRSRRPVKLVYCEEKKNLSDALRREREIKSFSHTKKHLLIHTKKFKY